jgi:hypothetical protein
MVSSQYYRGLTTPFTCRDRLSNFYPNPWLRFGVQQDCYPGRETATIVDRLQSCQPTIAPNSSAAIECEHDRSVACKERHDLWIPQTDLWGTRSLRGWGDRLLARSLSSLQGGARSRGTADRLVESAIAQGVGRRGACDRSLAEVPKLALAKDVRLFRVLYAVHKAIQDIFQL